MDYIEEIEQGISRVEKTDLQDSLEHGIVGGGILYQELVKLKAGIPMIEC